MSRAAHQLATIDDLIALPEDIHAELIGGEIIEKATPTAEHSDAQGGLIAALRTDFHRPPGSRHPGGWWILPEVDIRFGVRHVLRPDVAGWRRERVPVRPHGRPVDIRPDWVCEVLSVSNAATDLGEKFRIYQQSGVPHYWIADPEHEVLTVYRWTPDGYLVALSAGRTETVRAEPFEAIELRVGELFGEVVEGIE